MVLLQISCFAVNVETTVNLNKDRLDMWADAEGCTEGCGVLLRGGFYW